MDPKTNYPALNHEKGLVDVYKRQIYIRSSFGIRRSAVSAKSAHPSGNPTATAPQAAEPLAGILSTAGT